MTIALLLGGPLTVVFGCLYWLFSMFDAQQQVDQDRWKTQGL